MRFISFFILLWTLWNSEVISMFVFSLLLHSGMSWLFVLGSPCEIVSRNLILFSLWTGCAWDHPKPDEHRVRRPRLAPRHHPWLRRPGQRPLLQDAQSDPVTGLQRHLPDPRPPQSLFPWIPGQGHSGRPSSPGSTLQVRRSYVRRGGGVTVVAIIHTLHKHEWQILCLNSCLWCLSIFRITFPESKTSQQAKGKKRKADHDEHKEEEGKKEEDCTLVVEPHVIPNRGPYPYNQPKR